MIKYYQFCILITYNMKTNMWPITLLILILINTPPTSANEIFFEEVNPQFTLKAQVL